jgi:nucleotide-binding universal stress UspA family protein
MYKNILVPLDGSALSESILVYARDIVKECRESKLVLISVVEPFKDQPYRKEDDWILKVQKEAVRVTGNYLKILQEKLQAEGIETRMEVLEGDPAKEILDFAVKNGIDLIMLNSKGKNSVKQHIFGGVADKIIRHSTIPVLAVPPANIS